MCVVIYRMAASALLQFHKLAFFCTLFVMARTHSATWLIFHMLHFSAAHDVLHIIFYGTHGVHCKLFYVLDVIFTML